MPTNQIINDVLPWTQASASNLQTVFDTNWTAAYASDVVVYQRGSTEVPDELTQMLLESEYVVTFVGTAQVVRVTLLTPAPAGDIVTITRNTPVDRLNLYTNTNFVPSMLNQDTALLTLVDQERAMLNQQSVRYHLSGLNPNFSGTENPPVVPLGPNQIWAMNPDGNAFIAYDVPEGGGIATDKATFILQEPHVGLPNAQAMSELPTGFVVSNSGSGVQVTRVIEGIIHQTVVFNASGLVDNPSIGIADNAILPGTAGMGVPAGTTAQRVTPTGTNISLRFNTDLGQLEAYIGGQWVLVPSSAAGLFLPLAGGTMTGDINMGGHSITNLDDPSNAGDAVNKAYADAILALLGNYLPLAGGTMTGDILMDGHIIDGLPLPTGDDEAASKIYVDNAVGGAAGGVTGNMQWNNGGAFAGDPNFNTDGAGNVEITGSLAVDNLLIDGNRISATTGVVELEDAQLFNALDANSQKIENLAICTVGTDAANKNYVDATAAGRYFVAPVRASATANFSATYSNGTAGVGATLTATVNGAAALDGITLALNDRVLFPAQSSSFQNGIYTVTTLGSAGTPAIYTRATDYDQPSEIDPGDTIGVLQGNTYAGAFLMETAIVTTIGTDPITFILSVNPNVVTTNTTQTITGNKTFTGTNQLGNFIFTANQMQHASDTDNYFEFGTDIQNFVTGNSSRMDITNSGIRLGGANSRVTTVLDEDNMVSDSATALATQQSIKAYADFIALGAWKDYHVYNVAGTTNWNKPAYFTNSSKIAVLVVGGGGSSGGCAATGVGANANAGGGGGGGTGWRVISSSLLAGTETVTVGAGGSAPSAGNNNGSAGGTSSFGSFVTCTAGLGGNGSASSTTNTTAAGGTGGASSGGDINMAGARGDAGGVYGGVTKLGGCGGNSILSSQSVAVGAAVAGQNFGAGGSGGTIGGSSSAIAGAAGASGLVIVFEYL